MIRSETLVKERKSSNNWKAEKI